MLTTADFLQLMKQADNQITNIVITWTRGDGKGISVSMYASVVRLDIFSTLSVRHEMKKMENCLSMLTGNCSSEFQTGFLVNLLGTEIPSSFPKFL